MRGAGVALARIAALGSAAALLAEPVTATRQSLAGCREAVTRQLREWQAAEPSRPQPPGADGAVVRHWPTAIPGTWIVESAGASSARLTRVSPFEITEMTWATIGCAAARHVRPRPVPAGDRFTDADLTSLLATHPRGVVYVWSPHMPLSLDAVAGLRRAAEARDARVTLVLAPDADPRFAREAAAARGWPADALRVADAVELVFRDVLVHAPAVIGYAGGRLRGSAWPGAHTGEEYAAYLDRVFAGAP
jgi:hypothetical protein